MYPLWGTGPIVSVRRLRRHWYTPFCPPRPPKNKTSHNPDNHFPVWQYTERTFKTWALLQRRTEHWCPWAEPGRCLYSPICQVPLKNSSLFPWAGESRSLQQTAELREGASELGKAWSSLLSAASEESGRVPSASTQHPPPRKGEGEERKKEDAKKKKKSDKIHSSSSSRHHYKMPEP